MNAATSRRINQLRETNIQWWSWISPIAVLSLLIGIIALVLGSVSIARHVWSEPCDPSSAKIDISCIPDPVCVVNVSDPFTYRFNATVPVNSDGIIPPFTVTPITFPSPIGGISFLNSTFQLRHHAVVCDGSIIHSYRFVLSLLINATQSGPFTPANLEISLHFDEIPGLSDLAYNPGETFPTSLQVYSYAEESFVLGWYWHFSDSLTVIITGITDMLGEDTFVTTVTFSWVQ